MPKGKVTKARDAKRARMQLLFKLTLEELDAIDAFERASPEYAPLMWGHLGTDHCHISGIVRGRLEWRLNKMLGIMDNLVKPDAPKRSPYTAAEMFRALAQYCEGDPPAVRAIGPHYGLIGKAKRKKKMVYGGPPQ